MKQGRRSATLASIALALVLAAAPATADPPRHPISSVPYALPPACASSGLDAEISLSVDRRTGTMVAGWMQDVEGLGQAPLTTQLVVSSLSRDGIHWTKAAAPPGVMLCDVPPGPSDAVVDPSVSVGRDGRWYLGRLGQLAVPGSGMAAPGGVYVTTSPTGLAWRWPIAPMLDDYQDDFDTVVADPDVAGRAYATWTNYPPTNPPQSNRILFARTTNGGASFEPPRTIARSPNGQLHEVARTVVLSDGSLLVVFTRIPANTPADASAPFTIYATRSTDHGTTWSRPAEVARGTEFDVVDPKTHTVYEPHCCVISLAAGPRGAAHLAWVTRSGTSGGGVHVASSFDGGRTWSQRPAIERPAPPFQPVVAATDSTLAVMWYDFAGEQPAGQARPTSLWLARLASGHATWTVDHLAGPFDIATAPPVGSAYLGDFQSLVPVRGGFQAAFTLAKPLAIVGPTDVFSAFVPDLPAPLP